MLCASGRVLPCWTSYNPLNSPLKWVHLCFSNFIVFCVSGSDGKELSCNAGDPGSIPGLGREGNGHRLQSACLENPIDKGVWWVIVHRVAKGTGNTEQVSTYAHVTNKLLSRTNFTWTRIDSR